MESDFQSSNEERRLSSDSCSVMDAGNAEKHKELSISKQKNRRKNIAAVILKMVKIF